MLQNAYFLAKIGADTAENEQHFAGKLPMSAKERRMRRPFRQLGAPGASPARARQLPATRRPIGKISAKCCSFSAVSAPIFARKYAFFSIFQNLPDYPAENFEIWQYFANFAAFAKFLLNLSRIFTKIAVFSNRFFTKILRLQRCKRMQIL